jgi:hypothetical protein
MRDKGNEGNKCGEGSEQSEGGEGMKDMTVAKKTRGGNFAVEAALKNCG